MGTVGLQVRTGVSTEDWRAELLRRRERIAKLRKDFGARFNDTAFRLLDHVDFGLYCELRESGYAALCGEDSSGPCAVSVEEVS